MQVSNREKQFMVMWNAFVHQRQIYADFELPSLVFDFIVAELAAIQAGGFRPELLCHMMALCVWLVCMPLLLLLPPPLLLLPLLPLPLLLLLLLANPIA